MKKTFFAAVIALALCAGAFAQHTLLTVGFGRTPGTEVHIVNDTTDESTLRVTNGGKLTPDATIAKGNQWKKFYPIGYGDAPLLIQGCVLGPVAYTIIAPPVWTRDARIVGNAIFTEEYELSKLSCWSGQTKRIDNVDRFRLF